MKLLLLGLVLILSVNLFGQGILIKSTEKYSTVPKSSMSSTPPLFTTHQAENGDVIVLTKVGKQFSYFLFDKSLSPISNWNQKLVKGDFIPTDYLETSSGKFFLERRFNKKEKAFELYGIRDQKEPFGTAKLLFRHNYDDKSPLISVTPIQSSLKPLYDREGIFEVSENKAFVGYVNRLKAISNKEDQQLQLVVLDSKLKTAWERQITIKQTDKNTILDDYRIDNDGSLYLLFRQNKNAKAPAKYFVYVVSAEKSTKIEVDLAYEVLNCQMTLLRDNSLLVLGYYTKEARDFRKFFQWYDKGLKLKKELLLESEHNLKNLLPKTIFKIFSDNRVQEVFSSEVAQYADGTLQVIDQEMRYAREAGQIYNLQLGAYVSYTLSEASEVKQVDVVNRSLGDPTLVNAAVTDFIQDRLYLLFVNRRNANNLLLSKFTSVGITSGQPSEIDVKAVKNKLALENSFIYEGKLYLLSRKGTDFMTTGFQLHLIDLK